MTLDDDYYMNIALREAENALARGNVPVGAVLVRNREVLALGGDEKSDDPTAHAEINAIREACRKSGSWNLSGSTLYVTLEPCPMCAGACVNARVERVVFGASNAKSGAGGTLYNILHDSRLNHVCDVRSGVLGQECLEILQGYFLRRRGAARS